MLRITLQGMKDADAQMRRIQRGAEAMARTQAVVGSNMPYAYGAEYGYHRISRKLARRAGGTFYLRNAAQTVTGGADRDLSEGLKRVTAPGPWVLRRLALWIRRLARANAPRGGSKRSQYRLRRAIRYYARTR